MAAETCFRSAEKLIPTLYDELDSETAPLNGALLLRTIQYMMFDYLYKISPEKDPPVTLLAHWIALRSAYYRFIERWEALACRIQNNVRAQIMSRVNNDVQHPLVFLYDKLGETQELHIRRPKISPIRKTRNGARCYNCVDNSVCEFQERGKTAYGMFVFTPLPSDKDFRVKDPNEQSENFRLCLLAKQLANELPPEYDVPEQFCAVVTAKWCKLGRLLHNIFHLQDYINADILQEIDENKPEKLKKKSWEKVWERLVGADFRDAAIESFHKGKTHTRLVVSITQIYNIVTAAINLDPAMKK